jgi:hypothetical protein
MRERIDRKTDENLYQPKIHSKRIRALYSLKLKTDKPMTVLLDQAIHDLAEHYHVGQQLEEEQVYQQVDPETWEDIREVRKLLDQLDYLKCLEELEQFKSNE